MNLLLERLGEYKSETEETPQQVLDFFEEVREEFLRRVPGDALDRKHEPVAKTQLEDLIEQIARAKIGKVPSLSLQKAVKELKDDILGYGPITDFINDPDVEEIEVNRYDQIWIEKGGKNMFCPDVRFQNEEHLMRIIHRIVDGSGRRIDESSPMVDGHMPDGSRFNAVLPPIVADGACLTIRKFKKKLSVEKLIENGTISRRHLPFLQACVKARLNIMVTGGASTGKTNFLNFLSTFIDPTERIIVIEDTRELDIKQPNVVRLETRLPTAEGKGTVTIRDLVINSLRMRPDRIIVGEVRGGEAYDMLQAMNTGHDGSMTTGHANSPEDMLTRLESMVLMAESMNIAAIAHQIAAALDLIIHMHKFEDGSRKVVRIAQVLGVDNGRVQTKDLFRFKRDYSCPGAQGTLEKVEAPEGEIAEKIRYYGGLKYL